AIEDRLGVALPVAGVGIRGGGVAGVVAAAEELADGLIDDPGDEFGAVPGADPARVVLGHVRTEDVFLADVLAGELEQVLSSGGHPFSSSSQSCVRLDHIRPSRFKTRLPGGGR